MNQWGGGKKEERGRMFVPLSICTHNSSSSESTLPPPPPLFHRSVSGKRKAIGMSDAKDLGSGVFIGLVVDTRIKKKGRSFLLLCSNPLIQQKQFVER